MKTRHLFILMLAFAMFSCAQEKLEVAQAQMPEELVQKIQTHTVIDAATTMPATSAFKKPPIKCLDGSCDLTVQKFQAKYQALADATCSTVWGEAKCCLNDQEAYVLVLVHPQYKKCLRSQVAYIYESIDE